MSDSQEFMEFEDDEPIRIREFVALDLSRLTEGTVIRVLDDHFPECDIERKSDNLEIEITEHIYTKFWWHKYHASFFVDAMIQAVTRLQGEGHPFSNPTLDNDDEVHLFMRWTMQLPVQLGPATIADSINSAFKLVWERANSILENSDSVLILGKDTGPAFDKLKAIAEALERLGYSTYIIKEQPDRLGESVVQKVLRYALSSKFVLIENTEPSGHLYEVPHVTKLAECITVVLQEEGKGATWMFEDAYAKFSHWHKLSYSDVNLEYEVAQAAAWAENFHSNFAQYQKQTLPWMRSSPKTP